MATRFAFRRLSRLLVRLGGYANIALAVGGALLGLALVFAISSRPYNDEHTKTVEFRYLQDAQNSLTQTTAYDALRQGKSFSSEARTNRSEKPFWILADLKETKDSFVELPSRHVQKIQYWIYDRSGSVINSGEANRSNEKTDSGVRRIRAGFAIPIPKINERNDTKLLLRVISSGPARLSLSLSDEERLSGQDQYFDRSGGVLFGSILMIAAFSAVVAALAKDFTFILFGAWVIASLRIASYSKGWDFGWLGYQEAENYPTLLRNLPLAAYSVFTVTLFWSIFRKEIASLKASNYIRVLFLASMGLVAAGLVLPHRLFLPLLWSTVAPSVVVLAWLTLRIFSKTGASSAAWYGASWLVTLAGALSEVAYAAGLTTSKPTLISSVGSAVVSALLAAIAVAQRLNSEKSARIAAQAKSVQALTKFRENYNSMPVGLFSISKAGRISLYNPAFEGMFRLPIINAPAELPHIDTLFGPGSFDSLRAVAGSSDKAEIELQLDPKEGQSSRWFLARVTARDGSIEGSIQDITTRKEAENKLKHLVDHDPLSGLLNRRGLEQVLQAASAAAKEGTPCAIAHVDMDRFKLVNDLYGHSVGDGMLQAAAGRLSKAIRTTDRIARLADSFIIVLMDCPDHAVTRLTERLREMISEQPFEIEGMVLSMTVSIGVVALDPSMTNVDAMAAADRACAEAKAQGRNCVVRLNERDATLRSHLEELRVVAGLRQRVPTERYFLEFQPIVSLRAANQSLNYEVLIRMRNDDGGIVPPGKFIGAAERNGLMSQIDRWVLRSTLEWLDQHPAHRDRLTFATLNLSGASLNDARFVEDAFAMIGEHPIAATKLCFEITESIALHDVGSTRKFVDRVRAFGSKLALDDFGAGYTSFNYLKEIPADFIKIDGSFVKDINKNPGNYAITRTIVDLTHELGMSCIAEWAESPDTIASLIHLQVDYGQGFALARPMAKELVTNAISSASLVRDPSVVTMLIESNRQVISMHPAKPRRS